MTFVDAEGFSIAYDLAGAAGDDVMLFVHGHPFNRSMWRPQVEALAAAGWRAIAPDLRGYGETTVVPGKTTLDRFADDLVALLDHLGAGRVVVGGLSMGGQIAMEMARRHPSRVRALVLAATFPRIDTVEGQQARRAMADRLEREGMAGYAEEVLPKMVAPWNIAALPAVADHVSTMMRTTPPAGAAAALRGRAERSPYEPTLAALAVPALVVVGDDDAFTTREDVASMESLLRHGTIVRMPQVGHMPNLERTADFNDALIAFLRGLPAA